MYSIAVLTFCKLQRLYTVLAPILQYIYTGSHISIGRSYHLLLPTAIIIRLFRSSAAYSMHNGVKFIMKLNKNKAVLSVRKQLPEGRFGPTKYNNIGTYEQIVGSKRPSGNC